MRIEIVDADSRDRFVAYALAHGAEHDDSFANVGDLKGFDPAVEPAVLALADTGDVIGAASLMVRGYAAEGLARFRILHALDPSAYSGLLAGTLPGLQGGVPQVFLFLREPCATSSILHGLGFRETRRASILRRADEGRSFPWQPWLPEDVEIRAADPERDAAAWAAVANSAFAGDPGRFDVTENAAREWLLDPRIVQGGSLVAIRNGALAGVAVVMLEPGEDGGAPTCALETLAVAPEEQGRGVGRALLRAAILAGWDAGHRSMELSTGATNDRALRLYTSEGFEIVDVRVCWSLDPRQWTPPDGLASAV
jgi:ribosomal protein S18 acetylase RimI-like enzyme